MRRPRSMPDRSTEALVVTAIANLKDAQGNPLYSNTSPATLDRRMRQGSLPGDCERRAEAFPSIYTLDNTGPLTNGAAVSGEGRARRRTRRRASTTCRAGGSRATSTCTSSSTSTPGSASPSSSRRTQAAAPGRRPATRASSRACSASPPASGSSLLTCDASSHGEQECRARARRRVRSSVSILRPALSELIRPPRWQTAQPP